MTQKLRIAAWAAAMIAAPGCSSIAFDATQSEHAHAASRPVTAEQAALRDAAQAFDVALAETGVPAPRPLTEVLGAGLSGLIHGRAAETDAAADPADRYLASRTGETGPAASLVADVARLRDALATVNRAAKDLAQAQDGGAVTKADVREMERVLAHAQHSRRVCRAALEQARVAEQGRGHVDRALAAYEAELAASSKLADVLEALQNNRLLLG